MKISEKFKIEEEGKIFRRHSRSYVEERFFLMTKILDFAAICNKRGFRSGLISSDRKPVSAVYRNLKRVENQLKIKLRKNADRFTCPFIC